VEPGQNLLSWANANGVGETNLDRARTTRTFANHPLKSGLTRWQIPSPTPSNETSLLRGQTRSGAVT
jgi:hypothetical protein